MSRLTYAKCHNDTWHIYKYYSNKYDKKGLSVYLGNMNCFLGIQRTADGQKIAPKDIEVHDALPEGANRCPLCREMLKKIING